MDQQTYAFLSQPGVGFFSLIIIGIIAGWVAERVTASNHGLLTNLLVGVAGAFIGRPAGSVVSAAMAGSVPRPRRSAIIDAVCVSFMDRPR